MDPKEVEMVKLTNVQPILEGGNAQKTEKTAEAAKPTVAGDDLLKPGIKISPEVTEEDAMKLAERLYGITTSEICSLASYDDKNFLIHVDSNIKNPIIPNTWPHGYVIKVVNALDSQKTNVTEAQTQLLLFLAQQNIQCPRPVMNIYGNYYSLEKIGDARHIVRLLEFQPGKMFHEVLKTNHLFYQVGEFIAKVDLALKNFKHEAYDTYKSMWTLEAVPKLLDFLYAVKEVEKKDLVEQVVAAFQTQVLSNLSQFDKGIIHGDFNEQNIIVNKTDKPTEFRVSGIIDFGDSEDVETGGLVIAGYGMVRSIPEHELKVLKVCVAARLCQSLVMGAYTHTLDPENTYVLTTQKAGWDMLNAVWSQPPNALEELWSTTADNYLKQSYK